MADIYDLSSIPARFAAEVTRGAELEERLASRKKPDRGAENTIGAQNMQAARATLPEEMPDYAGMLSAEYVPPADTAYVLRRVEEIVREDALCGPWGRV